MTFPRSFINNLIPHSAVDVVGVYTQDFKQIFKKARPIKVVVNEDSKVMEHPVESGVITTDHRIILPTSIELSMVLNSLDYRDVYNEIRSYWRQGTLLIVQTRAAVYTNQLIASLPHEESPEQYDIMTMALKLKQVQIVTAKYGVVPRAAKHSATIPTGEKTSKPDQSFYQDVFYGSVKGGKQLLGITPTPPVIP